MICFISSVLNFYPSSFLLLFILFLVIYFYAVDRLDFWKKRNVRGPKPTLPFGNYKENILGSIHATELIKKLYDEYENEKMIGIFIMISPVLILRDIELIKCVLTKDFSVFSDRGICVYETVEPLSQHFFNLPKSSWYPLRKKLSSVFTISKIKRKFNTIVSTTERFLLYIEKISKMSDSLECSVHIAKFMIEVIGDYGFSLRMNEFDEGVSEFRMISKNRMTSTYFNYCRRFLREHCPSAYKYCFYLFYNKRMISYFVKLINNIFESRKIQKIYKNDYVGCLMELKYDFGEIELTDKMIAAQAYVFFTAGADTTAMTISNALYEIAVNPLVQKKLRLEINRVLKDEKILTFDNLKEMKYLNLIFKETLRKYALRNITRRNNKPYTLPGTNVTIPKNTQIIIPQYAIQHDHRIYAKPELFNPERFDNYQDKDTDPMHYLPFGDGPRKCIGELFAYIVSKILIASIVKNFELEACSGEKQMKENDPRKVFLFPKNGIHVKFKKL